MTELESFRNFCRERVEWVAGEPRAFCRERPQGLGTAKSANHANCDGGACGCLCHEPTPRDRALFGQLADEIDAFLDAGDPAPALWGDSA